ncbi:MAG: PBECR2 nuclease fold domain-containing protein, partial [Spirochaetaceae bacterium]|nr:PBECR2 nuclease fold domain-containing protein [Spirochaetaceae bacterium]
EENFENLFGKNKQVDSPLGKVKIGENQFKKLRAKNRERLLGPMHQTLTDPLIVIREERHGKKSLVYVKSFLRERSDKVDAVTSVVVDVRGVNVSISIHQRDINNILNKIKNPGDIVYEKTNQTGGASEKLNATVSDGGTDGPDTKYLVNSVDDNRSFKNIVQNFNSVNDFLV